MERTLHEIIGGDRGESNVREGGGRKTGSRVVDRVGGAQRSNKKDKGKEGSRGDGIVREVWKYGGEVIEE